MKSYQEFIENSFDFPNSEFTVENNWLKFNNLDLQKSISDFGSPLRLSYLPKIRNQIANAKTWFENALLRYNTNANYTYTYCTK